MSSASENTEIRTRFNSLRDQNIPVSWPNEDFTPPTDKTYVKFFILNGETRIVDIGSPIKTYRSTGVIFLQLLAPPRTGNGLVKSQADTMAAIFRSWCGSSVRCRAATVKEIGLDADGWYQVNVKIPFQRDELL